MNHIPHPGEENGSPVVIIAADRERSVLVLRRDPAPASAADVTFVAHARDDLARLISALVGGVELTDSEQAAIAARSDAASPGPWTPFLTGDGGVGGSNVIRVSDDDDQPDLYRSRMRVHLGLADRHIVGAGTAAVP